MRSRPVIGISCYVEPASWGAWQQVPSALLPAAYVAAVRDSGGVPVLLPPPPPDVRDDGGATEAERLVGMLDGLVLAGGADVDPARYGEAPHPGGQPPRADRDAAELALAAASATTSLPVLGVCRGMQVMAVAAGGALEQHVPDRVGHQGHAPGPGAYGEQHVRTERGTRLHALLGDALDVPCYHHQAVLTHPGYRACARADDGTLEAMEDPGAPFRLAVQWHPEQGTDLRLFAALVRAARG
ncbi:MAG TPA: gamma-glutamyl-gamma-aminobutyrate hydrolase family protein [Actinomycetales bacterium]